MFLYRKRVLFRIVSFFACLLVTCFIVVHYFVDCDNQNESDCRLPSDVRLEINDLSKIRTSLNSELLQLETKRNNLLRKIKLLASKHNNLSENVRQVEEKLDFLSKKLFYSSILYKQTKEKLVDDVQVVRKVNLNEIVIDIDRIDEVSSLENSYNLANCKSNQNLRISFFDRLIFDIDHENVLVSEFKSCVTIVFLNDTFNFTKLEEYIDEKQVSNLLFIDESESENLFKIETHSNLVIRRSLYSSFSRSSHSKRHSNLFIHFSLYDFGTLNDNPRLTLKKKYILSYHEPNHTRSSLKKILSSVNKNHFMIDFKCNRDNTNYYLCLNEVERAKFLRNSTFTLILQQESSFIRLIEAFKSGTIPIIVNLDLKFPLDDLIDYNQVIIRVPLSKINQLNDILTSMSDQDILSRRRIGFKLYQTYFSSMQTQFQTILAALRDRIGISYRYFNDIQAEEIGIESLSAKSNVRQTIAFNSSDEYLGPNDLSRLSSPKYTSNYTFNKHHAWNKLFYPFNLFPSTPFDPVLPNDYLHKIDINMNHSCLLGGSDAGTCFLHNLSGNHLYEQFTIVILTYRREKILEIALDRYVNLPYLNRILIIWNSIDDEPSNAFVQKFAHYFQSGLIKILRMRVNSLNNRFLPFNLIETDAILSLDDDSLLRQDEIIFAFRVWRESRERIVGFPARFHSYNLTTHSFTYQSRHTCEYSLVLTGASFYHRFYNYFYTYIMDKRVRELVDREMNCEDLAFNYMVSDLIRKPPMKVTSKWGFFCAECNNQTNSTQAFSSKPTHYLTRTLCLEKLNQIYGYNPLLYSQFKADSVLFKTKLPIDKQKCFKFV